MVRKQKSIIAIGFAILCVAAVLAGGLIVNSDSSRWTSHADTSWFVDNDLGQSFTIDTPAKLAGVAKLVNEGVTEDGIAINGFENQIFDIDRNLDLSAYLWEPIGTPENPFKGTMYSKNGAQFTISGLKLAPETVYAGLIGVMDGGTFGGFVFANYGSFSLHNSWQTLHAGVAVGKMINYSTVYNITNYLPIQAGSINASVYAGGIVGYSSGDADISNSFNHANLTINGSSVYAGGIAGYTEGTELVVKKVSNTGAVTANGFDEKGDIYAGGILGLSNGPLFMHDDATPIENTGAIAATNGKYSYAGGIVAKAASDITFSNATSNSGSVTVNAAQAVGSYAGGLTGSIALEQAVTLNTVTFASSGSIVNNGGTGVYTGGIAGYIGGAFQWASPFTNPAAVSASGSSQVYTGGLAGYAAGELSFQANARNSGAITVTGSPNDAYTGGLIGYSASRVHLLGTSDGAYGNSGAITVTGGTGVYTGGIAANRIYSGALGAAASNVHSTGNITVNGAAKLHTGGFVGQATDGVNRSLTSASYANTITVTATNPTTEQPVRTGGVIGYANGVQATDSEFGGIIRATGGDAIFTGGIAGAADGGSAFTNVYAGNAPELYATIDSDGFAGGIAGDWKGTMNGATAESIAITLTRDGGVAGGIAGKAQGEIVNAAAGNADYEGNDSVRIGMAEEVDAITAGGIVGTSEGAFHLVSGTSTKVALISEENGSGHKLGGIAGSLAAEAKVGVNGAPVIAEAIVIEAKSGNSDIGGVIGQNHAAELYLLADGIQLTVEGDSVNAGLIAGRNDGAISETASAVTARDGRIVSTGQAASLGGLVGENNGQISTSLTENVTIAADGAQSEAGGVAGKNTGALKNNRVFELAVEARGDRSSIGGVAGLSVLADGKPAPVIVGASVESKLSSLLTAHAADANVGGIVGSANGTEILQSIVTAEDGFNVMIGLRAPGAAAGGIAGRAVASKIVGDTVAINVQNLLLTTSAAATDAVAGGLVGYGDATRVDQAVGRGVNLLLSGSRATAGGMAGYNRGTDTAIIANVYVSGLHIRANAGAEASIVGGFVGLNDKRIGESTISPAEAVSTIQKSRYVGTVGSGSSPAILVQAPNVVVGGMVGENRSLIANNSISDKVPVTVAGEGGTLGGLVGVNADDGVLYYTYSNVNMNIQGARTLAGGLVGSNSGQVLSSYVESDLTGHSSGTSGQVVALGGLVGRNSGIIDKSYTSAVVTANGAYSVAGGLIGEQSSGTVSNSYVVKNVAVTGEHSYAGGLAGRIVNGKISNVYSTANVTAVGGSLAGGFAGRYDNASKELLMKTFYAMDEEKGINVDLSDFAEGNHKWMNSTPRLNTVTLAGLKNRAEFPTQSGWDFDSVWKYGSLQAEFQYPELVRSANTGGDGGSDVNANINWYMRDQYAVRYELHSESELAGLAAIVNGDVPGLEPFDFSGREIRIVNPIHIQSTQWVPIGMDESRPFEGSFNGGKHLIDGFTLIPDYDYSGLFGVIGEAGEVSNMLLEPLNVAGKMHTGVLAGFNKGVLDNIDIHLLKGAKVSGGIAGSFLGSNTGTFDNVTVTLENGSRIEAAYASSIAGGLIGHNATALTPDPFEFRV
ncbi:beta strand repeat-containing protein, partial [Paenibacillus agaridevorans]|uniref:beta strand repeat-containing protein n=1 Tax=Paenibacillus agaridevorans TaxID=171404 RepID=UPI0015E816DA